MSMTIMVMINMTTLVGEYGEYEDEDDEFTTQDVESHHLQLLLNDDDDDYLDNDEHDRND